MQPGTSSAARIGLIQPAWNNLIVENSTFLNYDREHMVAVGGFSKAFPQGGGYDFSGNGGMETRFSGTKWVNSDFRVRWRWDSEHLLTDMDGTFAEQPFCAGCHVLRTPLTMDQHAFPDCYHDLRYNGSVCKPSYSVIQAGFYPADPMLLFPGFRVSYRDEGGVWVRPDDTKYLFNKWWPKGAYNFVEMDASTANLRPMIVGERDPKWQCSWLSASGTWLSRRTANVTFTYEDVTVDPANPLSAESAIASKAMIAEFSKDGTTLTWVNGTSEYYGHPRQLCSGATWYSCEFHPETCTSGSVRYPPAGGYMQGGRGHYSSKEQAEFWNYKAPDLPLAQMGLPFLLPGQIMGGTSRHSLLIPNRRYTLDVMIGGIVHVEALKIAIGVLKAGEWIEFETNPYPAFLGTHVEPLIRPRGALPRKFAFDGVDGGLSNGTRPYSEADETFGGRRRLVPRRRLDARRVERRRLSAGTVTWNPAHESAILRIEGEPNCLAERPWDPCAGVGGTFAAVYDPPPSPPPPSPPLPPPPPPDPPPSPLPPAAPRAFVAEIDAMVLLASLSSSQAAALTETAITSALETHATAALPADEATDAVFSTEAVASYSVTVALTGDVTDTAFQQALVGAILAKVCKSRGRSCSVALQSAASTDRRRLAAGTMTVLISRGLAQPVPEVLPVIANTTGGYDYGGSAAAVGLEVITSGGDQPAAEELALVDVQPLSDSLPDRAEAALPAVERDVLASLPSSAAASIDGTSSVVSVGVASSLTTLGTDQSDFASKASSIMANTASTVGVPSSALVSSINVAHPPSPPPYFPPLPGSPPWPPLTPPGFPALPPSDIWSTTYTEGCDPVQCPNGCFSSRWSDMYTWHGQGKALGASEDDALFVWPGFKSNVTVKQCREVVLDLDLDQQLYSLVVWGTLRILDRGPKSRVSLKAVCILVQPGGRILAGEKTKPWSGVMEVLLSGDEITESHQCGGIKGKHFDIYGEVAL